VRVAIERWRHIVIYRQHFKHAGKYQTASAEWVSIAEKQLERLGPYGEGLLRDSRKRAIKAYGRYVVASVLGAFEDWTLLRLVFNRLTLARHEIKRLKASSESEDGAIRLVLESIRGAFSLQAAARRGFMYGANVEPVSPHLPVVRVPLDQGRRYVLERLLEVELGKDGIGSFPIGADPKDIERAVARLPEDIKIEMRMGAFVPPWRTGPLFGSTSKTKLELVLDFLRARPSNTETGIIRGGRRFLTCRETPEFEDFKNAFFEWAFELPVNTRKSYDRRRAQHGKSEGSARKLDPTEFPPIKARHLFPQYNI
jgi:hypothetical protein